MPISLARTRTQIRTGRVRKSASFEWHCRWERSFELNSLEDGCRGLAPAQTQLICVKIPRVCICMGLGMRVCDRECGRKSTCASVFTCVRVYVSVCMRVRGCVHIWRCVWSCNGVWVCVHACLGVCVCVCVNEREREEGERERKKVCVCVQEHARARASARMWCTCVCIHAC